MLEKIQSKKWKEIEQFITCGQNIMLLLKYTSFPIVTAASGIVLSGGVELILHSHFVQPYIETYMSLVEVGVGLVPGLEVVKKLSIGLITKEKNELQNHY